MVPQETFSYANRTNQQQELTVRASSLIEKQRNAQGELAVVLQAAPGSAVDASPTVTQLRKILNEKGIPSFALDHPGQGKRKYTSKFSFLSSSDDLRAFYHYLTKEREQPFDRVALLGNSLGAPITLNTAQDLTEKDSLILVSPILHPGEFIEQYAAHVGAPVEGVIQKYILDNNLHTDFKKLQTELGIKSPKQYKTWYNSRATIRKLAKKDIFSPHNLLITRMAKDKKSSHEAITYLCEKLNISPTDDAYTTFPGSGGDIFHHSYGSTQERLTETVINFLNRQMSSEA